MQGDATWLLPRRYTRTVGKALMWCSRHLSWTEGSVQSTRATLTVVMGYMQGQREKERRCGGLQTLHLAWMRAAVASQMGARRALQGHLEEKSVRIRGGEVGFGYQGA